MRLVKRAWRMGYRGLAAALAVAWDTMLSPVDVRALTRAQLRGDAQGSLFAVARAKTGKAAIGTLSRRTKRLLDTYSATLPSNLLLSAPIFCTRGGEPGSKGGRPWPPVPYTADTLGDDFRAVRGKEFPGDKRQLMDFRRSGAVEATLVPRHSLARWPTPSTRTVAGDLSAAQCNARAARRQSAHAGAQPAARCERRRVKKLNRWGCESNRKKRRFLSVWKTSESGGSDGARTRDLRRDRPTL